MHPAYFETRFFTTEPVDYWPDSFAIISGYATTGETWTDAQNKAADERLYNLLDERSVWLQRITGYSPTSCHAEPSWAVALTREEACHIGAEFEQDAIYYVNSGQLIVVTCKEDREEEPVSLFCHRLDK